MALSATWFLAPAPSVAPLFGGGGRSSNLGGGRSSNLEDKCGREGETQLRAQMQLMLGSQGNLVFASF